MYRKPSWAEGPKPDTFRPSWWLLKALNDHLFHIASTYFSAPKLNDAQLGQVWDDLNEVESRTFMEDAERRLVRSFSAELGGWVKWKSEEGRYVLVPWARPNPCILAIDDEPSRYFELLNVLPEGCELKVVCCPSCVADHLPQAIAVLLDHDITENPCSCGNRSEYEDVMPYIADIKEARIPVIITSASEPENRFKLSAKFGGEAETPIISVNDPHHSARWFYHLHLRRVLS